MIPLREPTFLILLSLATGPLHGYAIMKDVQALSEGRVILSTSTLYTALKRLLDLAWIRRIEDPKANANGRERKAYVLTELGRNVLKAEITRLESLVVAARRHTLRESG